MNRRDFIKATLAGGAYLWLPSYVLANPVHTMMMGKPWGGGNSQILYSGTLSAPRISIANALVDNLPAAVTDLVTAYGNGNLSLDLISSGLMLRGVMALGTGETTAELLADTGFDNTASWTKEGDWTVNAAANSKAVSTNNALGLYVYQSISAVGKLIKGVAVCSDFAAGKATMYYNGALGGDITGVGTTTEYRTAINSTTRLGLRSAQVSPTLAASFSGLSMLQITVPSTSGVTVTVSKGGAAGWGVNQWSSNYSGTLNQATYQCIVRRLR